MLFLDMDLEMPFPASVGPISDRNTGHDFHHGTGSGFAGPSHQILRDRHVRVLAGQDITKFSSMIGHDARTGNSSTSQADTELTNCLHLHMENQLQRPYLAKTSAPPARLLAASSPQHTTTGLFIQHTPNCASAGLLTTNMQSFRRLYQSYPAPVEPLGATAHLGLQPPCLFHIVRVHHATREYAAFSSGDTTRTGRMV